MRPLETHIRIANRAHWYKGLIIINSVFKQCILTYKDCSQTRHWDMMCNRLMHSVLNRSGIKGSNQWNSFLKCCDTVGSDHLHSNLKRRHCDIMGHRLITYCSQTRTLRGSWITFQVMWTLCLSPSPGSQVQGGWRVKPRPLLNGGALRAVWRPQALCRKGPRHR